MIEVTKGDLIQFLQSLPPEHEFAMEESYSFHKTGCVMVQYGKYQGWNDFACTAKNWYSNYPTDVIAWLNSWIGIDLIEGRDKNWRLTAKRALEILSQPESPKPIWIPPPVMGKL